MWADVLFDVLAQAATATPTGTPVPAGTVPPASAEVVGFVVGVVAILASVAAIGGTVLTHRLEKKKLAITQDLATKEELAHVSTQYQAEIVTLTDLVEHLRSEVRACEEGHKAERAAREQLEQENFELRITISRLHERIDRLEGRA